MPGQPRAEALALRRILPGLPLQVGGHRGVPPAAFDRVELVVEVLLKQVVPEPVHRALVPLPPSARPSALQTLGSHQVVLARQAAAQCRDDLTHRLAGQLGDELAGKIVALHAGRGEKAPAVFRQALNALGDSSLYARRQLAPVERFARRPTGPPRP